MTMAPSCASSRSTRTTSSTTRTSPTCADGRLREQLEHPFDHPRDLGVVRRIDALQPVDPALPQHRASVRERLEAKNPVVVAGATRADAAEWQMRVREVDQRVVDAGAAGGWVVA